MNGVDEKEEGVRDTDDDIEAEMDGFYKLRDKLMPWHKQIMIGGIIILISLVVFLGYAYGGLVVCAELDGLLDADFKCHPYFFNETIAFDADGLEYSYPPIIVNPIFVKENESKKID